MVVAFGPTAPTAPERPQRLCFLHFSTLSEPSEQWVWNGRCGFRRGGRPMILQELGVSMVFLGEIQQTFRKEPKQMLDNGKDL